MSRKWVYGKQDWKTYERGQENCYLMTNGLGGFSSMTMTGSVARNDHAFFMACTKAPNNRYNMVHRLAEKLRIGDREYVLSSQQSADGKVEDGYRYLSEFSYEDTPMWRFHVNGVEIVKEAAMKNGENTAALTYRIINRTRGEARLTVTPFYQFTPKGKEPEAGQKFEWREIRNSGINGTACRIESNDLSMELITDGQVSGIGPVWETYLRVTGEGIPAPPLRATRSVSVWRAAVKKYSLSYTGWTGAARTKDRKAVEIRQILHGRWRMLPGG